jgi:DNA-directed RNA polymerase specialized sigma24 family protein
VPLPPVEPLYEQLCALRDAESATDPRHAARWREVSRWLAQAYPGSSRELEDARQETLVSLVRHVSAMRAEGPLQAAKWVGTILRRKRIDVQRTRSSDPVERALRSEPRSADVKPLIDRIEAAPPPIDRRVVDEVVATVLEHVHRALEETERSATKRQLRRTQAQAALLRLVLDEDAATIASALDHGEPLGNDRIYKWVERGRPVVQLGLDRWEAEGDPDAQPVIEVLRETMDERRADAGVPRPERRKGGAEDVP